MTQSSIFLPWRWCDRTSWKPQHWVFNTSDITANDAVFCGIYRQPVDFTRTHTYIHTHRHYTMEKYINPGNKSDVYAINLINKRCHILNSSRRDDLLYSWQTHNKFCFILLNIKEGMHQLSCGNILFRVKYNKLWERSLGDTENGERKMQDKRVRSEICHQRGA